MNDLSHTFKRVKIFADGAHKEEMLGLFRHSFISGFTTNPTLMKKAGIADYRAFAKEILSVITDKPISFEVFSDDFAEMKRQAGEIASWGANVYVKIPVTNTRGQSSVDLIEELSKEGVKINVTAMMTPEQVEKVLPALRKGPAGYVSVFAGRIADSGQDPLPVMKKVLQMIRPYPHLELIWASPRELLNLIQADAIGCHIITVTGDLLRKLPALGKDLDQFSLETVRMFYEDAKSAGYDL